jgi:hypothetical protein
MRLGEASPLQTPWIPHICFPLLSSSARQHPLLFRPHPTSRALLFRPHPTSRERRFVRFGRADARAVAPSSSSKLFLHEEASLARGAGGGGEYACARSRVCACACARACARAYVGACVYVLMGACVRLLLSARLLLVRGNDHARGLLPSSVFPRPDFSPGIPPRSLTFNHIPSVGAPALPRSALHLNAPTPSTQQPS